MTFDDAVNAARAADREHRAQESPTERDERLRAAGTTQLRTLVADAHRMLTSSGVLPGVETTVVMSHGWGLLGMKRFSFTAGRSVFQLLGTKIGVTDDGALVYAQRRGPDDFGRGDRWGAVEGRSLERARADQRRFAARFPARYLVSVSGAAGADLRAPNGYDEKLFVDDDGNLVFGSEGSGWAVDVLLAHGVARTVEDGQR